MAGGRLAKMLAPRDEDYANLRKAKREKKERLRMESIPLVGRAVLAAYACAGIGKDKAKRTRHWALA